MRSTLAALAVAVLALTACEEQNSSSNVGSSNSSSSQGAASTASVDPTKLNWPPQPDNEVALATDYFEENLVVILDMSGSMAESTCKDSSTTKYAASIAAIDSFLNQVPDTMNVGFVVFEDGSSKVRTPLGKDNRNNIRQVLQQVRPDGGTPLGGAVYDAYNMLTAQAQAQLGYGQYRMLIVTDGAASDEGTLDKNIKFITSQTPIEVFTAGFCIDKGHTLYQPGITEFRTAGNINELKDSMQAVLAESNAFTQALTFQ
jgi:Ca-activated chloride channel homolog